MRWEELVTKVEVRTKEQAEAELVAQETAADISHAIEQEQRAMSDVSAATLKVKQFASKIEARQNKLHAERREKTAETKRKKAAAKANFREQVSLQPNW